jgi:hypothetical protein
MDASEPGSPEGSRSPEHGAGPGVTTIGQHVDRVSGSAQQAWSRTRDAVKDLKDTLDIEGRVDRNPYRMMALGVGVGYVLGGGIFSPLTARLVGFGLRLGLRLAAVPFIQQELMGLVDLMREGPDEPGARGRRAERATTATHDAMNEGR